MREVDLERYSKAVTLQSLYWDTKVISLSLVCNMTDQKLVHLHHVLGMRIVKRIATSSHSNPFHHPREL